MVEDVVAYDCNSTHARSLYLRTTSRTAVLNERRVFSPPYACCDQIKSDKKLICSANGTTGSSQPLQFRKGGEVVDGMTHSYDLTADSLAWTEISLSHQTSFKFVRPVRVD